MPRPARGIHAATSRHEAPGTTDQTFMQEPQAPTDQAYTLPVQAKSKGHPALSSCATTGGRACRLGQDHLRAILANLPQSTGLKDLVVGNSTNDDAAVLRIDGDRAIVQTVDFFTPIVDDPELFGAIAAANSISDIYAMGAEPILGLDIAGFPTEKLPLEVLEDILRGGAE